MSHRINHCVLAVSLLLAPSLAGCKSPEGVAPPAQGKQAPSEAKDMTRVLNKNPKHIVRIEGRVPDSLEIVLDAAYIADSKDSACFKLPEALTAPGLSYQVDELDIARSKGRYTAQLVIDKYLPGPCNWILWRVNAGIRQADKPDEEMDVVEQVIQARSFYHDEYDASGCSLSPRSGDHRRCPTEQNSLDTPVIVPCKVQSYKSFPDTPPSFFCPATSSTKADFKRVHRVKRGQKVVVIDFYDLDQERDPTE